MLFFFPAKIQAVVGVVMIVAGLTVVHSFIMVGLGVVGIAFGAAATSARGVRTVPAISAIIVKDLVKR